MFKGSICYVQIFINNNTKLQTYIKVPPKCSTNKLILLELCWSAQKTLFKLNCIYKKRNRLKIYFVIIIIQ